MNLAWTSSAPVRFHSKSFIGTNIICPINGRSHLRQALANRSSYALRASSVSAVHESQKSSRRLKPDGIRLNKCFTSFASRRESDEFIQKNRVKVNGKLAIHGTRVLPGDLVTLDGEPVDWERLTTKSTTNSFQYVKHWKRANILCTTDQSFENNIIQQLKLPAVSDRLFPIGRLDESSTGLILLTSDGRLPNAVLGASQECTKTYEVSTDCFVPEEDLVKLRKGIMITTEYRRSGGRSVKRVSTTLPCEIMRKRRHLIVSLREGRNRQIRKMFGALGYTVTMIHRIEFMGVTLDGLDEPGDSLFLNNEEMKLVKSALGEATH